jgi:hypothetical protein
LVERGFPVDRPLLPVLDGVELKRLRHRFTWRPVCWLSLTAVTLNSALYV